MSRPRKGGYNYFQKDTDSFSDRKIRRLIRKFGGNGYLTYDFILCNIYRDRGYYVQFDKDYCFDVADQIYLEENEVKEIVSYCCEIDLFDKLLFEKERIITSRGIQRRWLEMNIVSKRKDKTIPLNFLVDQVNSEETGINPEETPRNSEETPNNSGKSTQSKGKRSKGNEDRKKVFIPPSLDEFQNYFTENGYSPELANRAYKGYQVADWHDSKDKKIKNWKQKCQHVWFKEDNKINNDLKKVIFPQ